MDVRKLEFPNDYFDIIIDKGCLDCFHCGDCDSLPQAMAEIERVLKSHGTFLSISHSSPDYRTSHFIVNPDVYLKNDREIAKKEKIQRRSRTNSVVNSPAINHLTRRLSVSSTSGTPKNNRGSRRSSVIQIKNEPRFCFSGPIVHTISKQEKLMNTENSEEKDNNENFANDSVIEEETKTEIEEIEENARLNSANLGGWLDNSHFLYQIVKSKIFISNEENEQQTLAVSNSNTPIIQSRRVSIVTNNVVGQSSRAIFS